MQVCKYNIVKERKANREPEDKAWAAKEYVPIQQASLKKSCSFRSPRLYPDRWLPLGACVESWRFPWQKALVLMNHHAPSFQTQILSQWLNDSRKADEKRSHLLKIWIQTWYVIFVYCVLCLDVLSAWGVTACSLQRALSPTLVNFLKVLVMTLL